MFYTFVFYFGDFYDFLLALQYLVCIKNFSTIFNFFCYFDRKKCYYQYKVMLFKCFYVWPHPQARNRTQAPHALEGDFTIPFPSTSFGENVLNLNDQSDSGCKPGQYVVGLPVVTDDEGQLGLHLVVFVDDGFVLLLFFLF